MAVIDVETGNEIDHGASREIDIPGETHDPSEFHSRLDRLITDAPGRVSVTSGYRSPERQGQLFDAAVKKYGSEDAARRYVAPPGRSMHNHDLAGDLQYENEDTKRWVHDNAHLYGLHFPMSHEPWHVEPVGSRRVNLSRREQEKYEPLSSGIDVTPDMKFEPIEKPEPPKAEAPEQPGIIQRGLNAVKEHWEPADKFKLDPNTHGKDKPTFADYAKAAAIGAGDIPQAAAAASRMAGADKAADWLHDNASEYQENWRNTMTPAGRKAMDTPLLDKDNNIQNLRAVPMSAAESVPGMVAMGGIGKAANAGLKFFSNAERIAPLIEKATGFSSDVAKKVADWTINGISYGGAEGVYSGLSNAEQKREEILSTPIQTLMKNPAFQTEYQNDTGTNGIEKAKRIREKLANDAMSDVFKRTAISTGAIGALTGGGIFGQLENQLGKSTAGKIVLDSALEAGQEGAQSAGESVIGNLATQKYGDPNRRAFEGTVNDVATGALAGGLLGGVGGAGGVYGGRNQPADNQPTGEEPSGQSQSTGESNAKNPSVSSTEAAKSREGSDQENQSRSDHAVSSGPLKAEGGQTQEGNEVGLILQKTPHGFAVATKDGTVISEHPTYPDALEALDQAKENLSKHLESQNGEERKQQVQQHVSATSVGKDAEGQGKGTSNPQDLVQQHEAEQGQRGVLSNGKGQSESRMEQQRGGNSSASGRQDSGMDAGGSTSDAEAGTDRKGSKRRGLRGLGGDVANDSGTVAGGVSIPSGGERASAAQGGGTGVSAIAGTGRSSDAGTGGLSEPVSAGAGDAGVRGDGGYSLSKRKESEAPIIQNRDRSNPASIQQMQSISADPRYRRLGPGNEFGNGAPVVAGGNIPAAQLGNEDVAETAKNREIPFRYAVVEAKDVLASNNADGTPNAEYADNPANKIRAIAGNGRIAGLQKAHKQGTATDYVEKMIGDSGSHGVSPDVIRSMRHPVLVRVMSESDITKDIGDESNIGNGLGMSALEKARNDSQRIDLAGLNFNEDGEINEGTVKQFVRTMPESDQGELLDTDGSPNKQAHERLKAAVFYKAYRNDELVRLFAQSADPDARLVISALARVAPKIARLEGTGYEDIGDLLAAAAIAIVNGRSKGQPMSMIARQVDMNQDPGVSDIIGLFAENPRSNKMAIAALTDAADFAFEESNNPEEDLFGERQKATRQDVLDRLRAYRGNQKESLEHAGGGKSPESNDGAQETGREGQGNTEEIQRGKQEGQGAEEALAPIKERREARKNKKESSSQENVNPGEENGKAGDLFGEPTKADQQRADKEAVEAYAEEKARQRNATGQSVDGGLFDQDNRQSEVPFSLNHRETQEKIDAYNKAVDRLNSSNTDGSKGPHRGRVEPAEATDLPASGAAGRRLAGAIAALFGHRIIYIRSADGTPLTYDGSIVPGDPTTILIANDAVAPVSRVVAHEMLHGLRRTAPQIYDNLVKSLRTIYSEDAIKKHLSERGYPADVLTSSGEEEWVADFVSDVIHSPDALVRVAFAMNRNKAGSGYKFLQRVQGLIDRIKQKLSGDGFDADKAISESDLESARTAVIEALAQYAEHSRQGTRPEGTSEIPKALRSGSEGSGEEIPASFAGRSAHTANTESLRIAQKMLKERRSPEVVRRNTGWFIGHDGEWRYEIPDNEAKFIHIKKVATDDIRTEVAKDITVHPEKNSSLYKASYRENSSDYMGAFGRTEEDAVNNLIAHIAKDRSWGAFDIADVKNGETRQLGRILNHPRLFEAYPSLEDAEVTFRSGVDYRGVFHPADGTIGIAISSDHQQMLSTLLHEVQHAIQHIEGFATGGNTDSSFTSSVKAAISRMVSKTKEDAEQWKWKNSDKLSAAERASEIARYALMYDSAKKLFGYADRPDSSRVFRLIRNEMQWIYGQDFYGNEEANELQRSFWNIPKRHKLNERNRFISDMAYRASKFLMSSIPEDLKGQFRNDKRTMRSMLNALQREADRKRKETEPLREMERAARTASGLSEAHKYSSSFDLYRSLAGEAEARNTQARQALTEGERRDIPPSSTQDVPSDKVIVMFGGMDVRVPSQNKEIEPDIPASNRRPVFYSPLERGIQQAKIETQPASQWRAWLQSNKAKLGIKDDEIAWSGLDDYLNLKGKEKLSKDDISAFLKDNGVQVSEVMNGGDRDALREGFDQAEKEANEVWYKFDDARSDFLKKATSTQVEASNVTNWINDILNGREFDRDLYDQAEQKLKPYIEKDPAGFVGVKDLWKEYSSLSAKAQEISNSYRPTKYGTYTLPGGNDYRELLLTLPPKQNIPSYMDWRDHKEFLGGYSESEMSADAYQKEIDYYAKRGTYGDLSKQYSSSHWEEPNVLAHIRFNDRTDAEGKKVLFVEEIQSDWAQEGRKKGFGGRTASEIEAELSAVTKERSRLIEEAGDLPDSEMKRFKEINLRIKDLGEKATQLDAEFAAAVGKTLVPNAPFIKDTKAWVSLAIKRMIRYAAEGGYDKVAFVNGEQSADRYDLSQQISKLEVTRSTPTGDFEISAEDKNGQQVLSGKRAKDISEVEDLIGKEMAKKVEDMQPGDFSRTFTGLDLKVGGEGMKSFYDKIVPQIANDVLKKVGGGKVGMVTLDNREPESDAWYEELNDEDTSVQPGFDVTPAMRDKALEGLPMFSNRRTVTVARNARPLTDREIDQAMRQQEERDSIPRVDTRKEVEDLLATSHYEETSKEELQKLISDLSNKLDQRRAAQIAKDLNKDDRVRGYDWTVERLTRAKRLREIDPRSVDLALWFLQKNPSLADGLAWSFQGNPTGVESGSYNPSARISTLIKGSGSSETATHEILHHIEGMMPRRYRAAILKEYSKALSDVIETNRNIAPEQVSAVINALGGHWEPYNDLFKSKQISQESYQFTNPSEYWAVNGARILNQRMAAAEGGVWKQIQQWLREFKQKIRSLFGLPSNAAIIRALDAVIDGRTGDRDQARMLASRFARDNRENPISSYVAPSDVVLLASNDVPASNRRNVQGDKVEKTFTSPVETTLDNLIYTMQDKLVDTKRVQQAIEKANRVIDDKWDPYQKELLYHGRSAKLTQDFLVDEIKPLFKAMSDEGISMEDLETFLWNRHAKERNDYIASINPGMPNAGSGIKSQDARAYLSGLDDEQREKLERLAKKVDKISEGTRDLLVDTGLETIDTILDWQNTYEHYVPLQRADVEGVAGRRLGTGQGFSIKGSSSKRAFGSDKPVVDILANLMMQRERAIVRSEKNVVALALYGLAIQNENSDFWLPINPDALNAPVKTKNELMRLGMQESDVDGLMREPTVRVLNKKTGLVEHVVNPVLRNRDNVLAVRIKGKDRFIFFNQDDPRAIRMVEALKNLDADQLGTILTGFQKVTRWFASVNTQWNPIFGVVNLTRDVGAGAINLTSTQIAGKEAQVLSHVMPAISGIYRDLRADRAGKARSSNEWSVLWERFQRVGGKTGYRDLFVTSEDRAKALQKEIDAIHAGAPKKFFRGIFGWLSDYNETLENGVRLAAFKVAIDQDLSDDRAAALAKNLTVNFNKKGQIAQQAGALYAFFNASVQSSARIAQTMAGPAGKKIVIGGLLVGAAQAVLLAAAGFDDEEPPESVRERNIIIPTGGKKFVSIPMALGFHVIPNTSRVLTELALSGGRDAPKKLIGLLGSYIDAFDPMGSSGMSVQTLTPTLIDPLVALSENRDSFGREIARKDRSDLDRTPGFTRAKETASMFGHFISRMMNTLSGGTEYAAGEFSPTPDQIDYLIGQVTGGLGREYLKADQTIRSMISGEELPPNKIPLVGRFYGNANSQSAEMSEFYQHLEELNKVERNIEGLKKDHKREELEAYKKENPDWHLYNDANAAERRVHELRAKKRVALAKNKPKEDIKKIEADITAVVTKFNQKAAVRAPQ